MAASLDKPLVKQHSAARVMNHCLALDDFGNSTVTVLPFVSPSYGRLAAHSKARTCGRVQVGGATPRSMARGFTTGATPLPPCRSAMLQSSLVSRF